MVNPRKDVAVGAMTLILLLVAGCAESNPRLDCGNALLDSSEACDDGNRDLGDGCDSNCQIEPGFSCFGEPSLCETGCGDSTIGGAEECDDGNLLAGDGCSSACAIEPGFTCSGEPSLCESTCGDGAVASTEECDDGNLLPGDGCTAGCQVEDGWICDGVPSLCEALCGNSTIDAGEECDGGQLDGQTCTSVPGGYTGGDLACSTECAFDIGGCISVGCGNNTIDTGEQCDDGNTTAGDGCTANCQVEAGWDCTGTPSVCVHLCGNATLDTGEDCDGGLLGGMTCATVPGGFTDGSLGCTADCQFDTLGCTTCGNNVPELGEQCDDGNTTAGDGCSPNCQTEALPVLYWATGNPAVWSSMTITYAGDAHAPQTPILAAANADQRGYAYVFTATTYHQLSLPDHAWIGHGALNTRFPGVPGAQLREAVGISWSSQSDTLVALFTNTATVASVYKFDENNATGVVTPQTTNPSPHDWLYDPNGPSSNLTDRALFQVLSNDNGWTHYDVHSLCTEAPVGSDVVSYLGVITTANQLYLSETGWCWAFFDDMPTSQFTPFTAVGSPATADIVAAFYTTEHGNRLYVVIQP